MTDTPTETEAEPAEDFEKNYYPTAYVAEVLGLSAETIRDWIARGVIKAVKIERQWRVPRSELVRVANDRHG